MSLSSWRLEIPAKLHGYNHNTVLTDTQTLPYESVISRSLRFRNDVRRHKSDLQVFDERMTTSFSDDETWCPKKHMLVPRLSLPKISVRTSFPRIGLESPSYDETSDFWLVKQGS